MRIIVCGIVLAVLMGATGADAGVFSRFRSNKNKRPMPKPFDYPYPRPKYDEYHKQGKRVGRHPEMYSAVIVADLVRA